MSEFNEGRHDGCKVLNATFGQSSKKGTPGLFIDFEIGEGAVRTVNLWLSPAARDRSETILKDLGFNWDYNAPLFDPEKSQNVTLEMRKEEFNGKPQERWEFPRGSAFAAAPPSLAAQFSAEAKARHGSMPTPNGKPSAPPARSSAPPPRSAKPAYGKNEAWADYSTACEKGGAKADGAIFNETIETLEKSSGKGEAKFTEEDWRMVVANCPPF